MMMDPQAESVAGFASYPLQSGKAGCAADALIDQVAGLDQQDHSQTDKERAGKTGMRNQLAPGRVSGQF